MKTSVRGAAIVVAVACGSAHGQIRFQLLPLAPTMTNSTAEAMSADGSVIVGTGNGPPEPVSKFGFATADHAGAAIREGLALAIVSRGC